MAFYNTYSEQFTYDRSIAIFESMKRMEWISYAFTPIFLLLKFTLISVVLYTGIFFYNLIHKISFGDIFRIVIACEIVFLLASFVKFIWFFLFAGNYDLNDLGFFYPLSLINLFRISQVDKIWRYPMQVLNLFQIIYIVLLSFGIRHFCHVNDSDSDKVVLSSYLPALFIWIALIMFVTIEAGL